MRISDLTARVRRPRRSSCFTATTKLFGVVVLTDDIDRACVGASRLVPLIHFATDTQPAGTTRPASSNG